MTLHPIEARHRSIADQLASRDLDGLVVTNPANLRYLTGFGGSAGLLLVTAARLYLVVDFRYSAAVLALLREQVAPPTLVHVPLQASTGYDRRFVTLVAGQAPEAIAWDGGTGTIPRPDRVARRIGFEAGHVPVQRWRGWESKLSAVGAERVALVETDRLVEAARERKDASEVASLREGARRLSQVAREVLAETVRVGQSELENRRRHRLADETRRIRETRLRHDRGLGAEQRASARAADATVTV